MPFRSGDNHEAARVHYSAWQCSSVAAHGTRAAAGGQLKMTFAGNVSSLGYLTAEDAKLNVIVRAKGGASLHSGGF
jgi:hypothetical protein